MSGLVYKNVLSLSCVLLMTACSSTAVVRPPEYKTPLIQADEQYKYAALNWTEKVLPSVMAQSIPLQTVSLAQGFRPSGFPMSGDVWRKP